MKKEKINYYKEKRKNYLSRMRKVKDLHNDAIKKAKNCGVVLEKCHTRLGDCKGVRGNLSSGFIKIFSM